MSIQKSIENVINKKMDPYVRKGDLNDVNMELIAITNHLAKTKRSKCIYVPKTLYYYKKIDIEDSSEESESSIESDTEDSEECVLTFEFPYYGHLVKNVKVVQKGDGVHITKCQMKTKTTHITFFESEFEEPVNVIELVKGTDLLPIVNMLNDTIVVKIWINSSNNLYDYELQHDVYFFKDDKLGEIRNLDNFEYDDEIYITKNGKLKQ